MLWCWCEHHHNGFVNRQYFCIWRSLNPHVFVELTCHCLVRFLGWRHHWAILYENEAGQAVTVTDARYRQLITQFFLVVYSLVLGDQNWPPRSCDFKSIIFIFMGLFEVKCICQQGYIDPYIEGGNSTVYP